MPKLNCRNQSYRVQFVTTTKQDNDLIDCIGVVYIEIETELLGPIEPSAVYY